MITIIYFDKIISFPLYNNTACYRPTIYTDSITITNPTRTTTCFVPRDIPEFPSIQAWNHRGRLPPIFSLWDVRRAKSHTCCPPTDSNDNTNIITLRRRGDSKKASDAFSANTNSSNVDPMPCYGEDNGKVFPRLMKRSMPVYPDTFLCRDQDLRRTETFVTKRNKIMPRWHWWLRGIRLIHSQWDYYQCLCSGTTNCN